MADKFIFSDMETLERFSITTFAEDPDGWIELITIRLNLPIQFEPAVREVVAAGKWREASSPMGFVHTLAKRRARSLGLEDLNEEEFRPSAPKQTRVQPFASVRTADPETGTAESHEASLDRVQFEYDERHPTEPNHRSDFAMGVDLDWGRISQEVGLSPEASDYLIFRALGAPIGDFFSERSKKELQRAYPAIRLAIARQVNDQAGMIIMSERKAA